MSKYKVCVYAICKNEAKFVEKWMASMGEADEIIVTDTGSDDDTVEKLRELGATVYVEEFKPWRFDTARNKSLEHVPLDADICVCTDLDEIFLPGWREKLEAAWTPGTKQGKYTYNWSLKPDGTPYVQLRYFKVHTRKDFKWNFPVHEVLGYTKNTGYKEVFIDGMILNHYPDATKSRGSYIGLLEMGVKEDPESDRMTYYLGREYLFQQRWQDCIDILTHYLTLKSAWWRDERCAAMRWIAKANMELNRDDEAYKWYYRAIGEVWTMRDPYVEFAKLAYKKKDWNTCYFVIMEALKITEKSKTYTNQGYAWDYTPYDLGAISAYYLGLYKESYRLGKIALEMKPGDERLEANLKWAEDKL